MDKSSNTVKFIDIAIPGDCRVRTKVIEKKEKYTDLCIRVQRMWLSSAIVVPVVIGALGSVPRDLEESLHLIGLEKWIIPVLQKTVLLNTRHILRHFLTHSTICYWLIVCMCVCVIFAQVPGWYWDIVPDCHLFCEYIHNNMAVIVSVQLLLASSIQYQYRDYTESTPSHLNTVNYEISLDLYM